MPRLIGLSLLCISLFNISCSKTPDMIKIEGFAQGTTYHITYELADKGTPAQIEQAISDELTRIDKVFSNYRDDSLIEIFNAQKSTEPQAVDSELIALIEEARKI